MVLKLVSIRLLACCVFYRPICKFLYKCLHDISLIELIIFCFCSATSLACILHTQWCAFLQTNLKYTLNAWLIWGYVHYWTVYWEPSLVSSFKLISLAAAGTKYRLIIYRPVCMRYRQVAQLKPNSSNRLLRRKCIL